MGPDLTQRLVIDVRDALASGLDLRAVVAAAKPSLQRLVGADCVAIGSTLPGARSEFEWIVADMPPRFFSGYSEIAAHDFVLRAVLGAPNRVLRDSEMLPRRELERNAMYGRSRDVGSPLEQVMSAMLHVDDEWASGISLFRTKPRPFTERESALLQSLVPALRNTVRNCRAFGQVNARAALLEGILVREGAAALVLTPSARELARTDSATRLLESWFRPCDRQQGLPSSLVQWASQLNARPVDTLEGKRVLAQRPEAELVASAYWLEHLGRRCLVIVLHEDALSPQLPERWAALLTPREIEIIKQILDGRTNADIANLLGISESTVKKHIYNIFQKLGIEQRAQLIAKARDLS